MPPLSHGQRSLWFLHHFAPGSGASNIAAAARVLSPVDAEALERAFQALVDRHAALRTTFPAVDGEPSQEIADRLDLLLEREDATGWSGERLRARLAEEAWRPFDLEHGPLLRVTLFTGGPEGPGAPPRHPSHRRGLLVARGAPARAAGAVPRGGRRRAEPRSLWTCGGHRRC